MRILLVEDSAHDAELVQRELARAGLACEFRRVDSEPALREALLEFRPGLVISDFSMPGFDGRAALAICRDSGGDIPFVFMSGTVGEDVAVDAMRAGADDYVMKSNLVRLAPAVRRCLRDAEAREQRKVAELALRRAQSMAMLAHVVTGRDGGFESWSDSLPQLVGIGPEAMPRGTREWLALVHPGDRAAFRGTSIEAARRGTRMSVEYRLRHADGRWVHVHQVMEPLPGTQDAKGRMRWFGTLLDVTALRQASAELRASEERYRATFQQAAVGVVHTSLDGDLLVVNPKFCDMTGYPPAEAIQRSIRDLAHPEDTAGAGVEGLEQILSRGSEPYEREIRLIRKDGGLLWVSMTTSLVRDREDRPSHFISVIHDISERKRAEEESRRFRAAIDASIDSIYITDLQSMRFVYVNEVACRRLGYERARLLEMGPRDVLKVDPDTLRRDYEQVIAAGERGMRTESRFLRSDGSEGWTEIHRRAVQTEGGRVLVTLGRDVTGRKRAEAELLESEARFRSLTQLSSDWYWEQDAEYRFTSFTGGEGDAKWGPDQEGQIGKRRWEISGIAPLSMSWDEHRALLEARKPFRDFEYARDGGAEVARYVSSSGEPVFDGEGRFTGYRGTARDITQRRRGEERIRRLNRVYAVLSGINGAIVRIRERDELCTEACRIAVDAGRFAFAWLGIVNRAEQQIRVVASAGRDEGFLDVARARLSLRDDVPDGAGPPARAVKSRQPVVVNDVESDPGVRYKREHADRGIRSFAMLPLMVEGEAIGVLSLHAADAGFFDAEEMKLLRELAGDISFALEHIEKGERADYLSYYDELTGLANRRLFLERLGQYAIAAGQAASMLAVVLLDLERLRAVNESFGRIAGDAVLRDVARRLGGDTDKRELGRISADHFAVVLKDVRGRSEVVRKVERMWHATFDLPLSIDQTDLRMSARGGIALCPKDGTDAEALLGYAEAAMRKAKKSGERFVFYDAALTEHSAEALSLETKLRRALEREEFVLHYQPKVDARSGALTGLEALIRWQSPELGLVPPGKFIGLMEETGMILEAGHWALTRAAADHARWLAMGLAAPRVAVNVSSVQLRKEDFVESVRRATGGGAMSSGIDLEITESLMMEDVLGNIDKLRAIRDLGMSVAIDDFGTGYSSLGYLARLPVQALKIDRSFIITMLKNPDTMTLVRTIVSLAHSLRLTVVAEGVDEEEQATELRAMHCDQIQGYLTGRPVPFDEITALLKSAAARGNAHLPAKSESRTGDAKT